jgi:hypothetical protein
MPLIGNLQETGAIVYFEEKPMKNPLLQFVLLLALSSTAGANEVTYVLQTPGVV